LSSLTWLELFRKALAKSALTEALMRSAMEAGRRSNDVALNTWLDATDSSSSAYLLFERLDRYGVVVPSAAIALVDDPAMSSYAEHRGDDAPGAVMTLRPVEYFAWLLPSDRGGKPHKSHWKMTREQALAHPGAQCIESSREVRMINDEPPVGYGPSPTANGAPPGG
jgi:hypothetical protein